LLGPTFPLAPLVQIRPRPRELLQDAVDEGLVRIDDDARVGYFLHGLVVEELTRNLSSADRVEQHDKLCRALLALEESPVAIATQAFGARDLDSVRVVVCSLAAAQQQAQVFEWTKAIDWANKGLSALDDIAGATPFDDDAESGIEDSRMEVELRLLLGQGLRRTNEPGSQEHLGRAADLAEAIGADELFVNCVTELCSHGPTTQAGTVDPAARRHLDRALNVRVGRLQRAKLLSAAATLLAMSDEWGVGRTRYREALNIVEAAGETEGLRVVRMNAHLGLSHPADIDDRREAAAGLLALDDDEAQWEGNFLGVGLALIDADRVALEKAINALRELTSVVKQRDQRRALDQMETVWAYVRGDLDEAARLADETFHISLGAFPMSWAKSIYAALLVPIREAQGRGAELLPQVQGLIESAPDFITWRAVAASVAYAARDRQAMRTQLDYISDHKFQLVEDLSWTAVATIVCRPIWALNDRNSADVLYDMLKPYKGQMTWNGLSTHGPVDAGLACLASTLGDAAKVAGHVSTAQTLVKKLGAPHILWPELASLHR
jgi:hypothetical protein